MATPLLELEGTWEELAARASEFAGRRLRLIVLPGTTQSEACLDRPIDEVLAELASDESEMTIEEELMAIAARIPAEERAKIPADLTDQLDHYIYGTPKK